MDGTSVRPPDVASPGTDVDDPVRRRRRQRRVVAGVVVVLVIVGAWVLVAAHQRSQLVVWFDAVPVECADEVPLVQDLESSDDPVFVPIVALEPGLDCRLRVHVEHRGSLPTTLRNITLSHHGPASRMGPLAGWLSPLGIEPAVEEEVDGLTRPALDAVYDVGLRLEPGESLLLEFAVSLSPNACMAPGTRTWGHDQPRFEVRSLGLTGDRAPDGIGIAYEGTAASACSG